MTKAEVDSIVSLAKAESLKIESQYLHPGSKALGIVFATLRLKRSNQHHGIELLMNLNRLIEEAKFGELTVHSVIIEKVLTAGGESNLHPGVVVFIWSRDGQVS
ncbi:hypothetical protein D9M69_688100 [compost metagenome]